MLQQRIIVQNEGDKKQEGGVYLNACDLKVRSFESSATNKRTEL
jgi:hypothetical protein